MKKILVPTDFSNESLRFVQQVAQALPADKLDIVLFHAFVMPVDVMDLMFIHKDPFYKNLISDSFRKQCKKMKDQFPYNIHSISFKHIIGDTKMLFNNFLEANDIDMIFYPGIELSKPYSNSANILQLLRTGKKPFIEPVAIPAKQQKIKIRTQDTETIYA